LQAIALGEIGISHADFWQMTLQELLNAEKGFRERQLSEWRRVRWMATVFAAPYSKEDISPQKLLPLPGDEGSGDFMSEIDKIKERRKWLTEQ
jgi:hypothetical protein